MTVHIPTGADALPYLFVLVLFLAPTIAATIYAVWGPRHDDDQ